MKISITNYNVKTKTGMEFNLPTFRLAYNVGIMEFHTPDGVEKFDEKEIKTLEKKEERFILLDDVYGYV